MERNGQGKMEERISVQIETKRVGKWTNRKKMERKHHRNNRGDDGKSGKNAADNAPLPKATTEDEKKKKKKKGERNLET